MNKFEVKCLSGTFLNLSIQFNYSDLNFPGYKLVRADHTSNTKQRVLTATSWNQFYLKYCSIYGNGGKISNFYSNVVGFLKMYLNVW